LKPALAWSGGMEHTLAYSPGVAAPVARASAEQGLGEFIDARAWGGRRYILTKLVASGAAMAAMALIIGLLHFLYIFSIFLLFYFVWGISNAIAALVRGEELTALYVNGIVHTGRDGILAVPWPQVARLGKSDRNRGLTGGRRLPVYLEDGRCFQVPLVRRKDGTDQFAARIAAALRQYGRPVE
jgi:hypothetical protein